ncbi:MAG TPA: DUF1800 domain-containing protein, partial [Usitatibacter sp.]|nr:DUF1800 domain-containing protein [Usitatibacter sp.]
IEPTLAPPAFVSEPFLPYYRIRALDAEARAAERRKRLQEGFALRAWWLHEMAVTPTPLTERMTLFWHGHFATSQQKVRSVRLMYAQHAFLRREALGNFGRMLHGIARDPAMLVYLDNAGSRREAPNENFAREVMELFTLGEGHYAERDVKEAARAFTGWSLDRETGEYRYRRAWHDGGEKTVLGKRARLEGAAVLDLLLAQPRAAEHVTAKLWRELVSPAPDEQEVKRLAAVFRENRYEVKPLLRAMFLSNAFWDPDNRATLIKSPVDVIVGTLRTFGIQPLDYRPAAFAVAALGQNLFAPPNVKGWPGAEAWIDASTLLGRRRFVDRVFRGNDSMTPVAARDEAMDKQRPRDGMRRSFERGMSSYAFDPERWSAGVHNGMQERGAYVTALVLAAAPANPVPAGDDEAALVRALVADPVYQLR